MKRLLKSSQKLSSTGHHRPVKQFHVVNFGCRATQADGAAIQRDLIAKGCAASAEDAADFVVINTCTVTASADAHARAAVRRVHRQNPAAKILVTGCYAQRAPEQLASLPGVSWVVGNSHKHMVAEIVTNRRRQPDTAFVPINAIQSASSNTPELLVSDIFAHTDILAAPVLAEPSQLSDFSDRTRANLKVQDGCNNRCSFCVIPYVRGKSRSLPADRVLSEAEQLVRAGFTELVLSGINLGRWGRDLERKDKFPNLIRYLLQATAIQKLRISSVEPMDWTDELIDLVASEPRIAKPAHIPLQSGSDSVLRRMHRKYRPWHYEDHVHRIRDAIPDAAIGADVMVGFPGETAQEFQETYAFIERLPFTYLHVFTFSARPGTPAVAMHDQVPVPFARQRNAALRALISEKNRAFRSSFVGRTLQAITLERSQSLTDNFIKLQLRGDQSPNQWLTATVTGLSSDGLIGSVQ